MIRHFFLFAACALLVLCQVPPAFAVSVVLENEGYSAELPKGWTANEEDTLVRFESGGKKTQTILCDHFRLRRLDTDLFLQTNAKDGQVRKLGDTSYIYVTHSGARAWLGITEPDDLFVIVVDEPIKVVPAFLKSLKPLSSDTASYDVFFKEAGTQAVVDWLAFTAPDIPSGQVKKEAPKKSGKKQKEIALKPFSGNGLSAAVPAGWAIESKGPYVYFTAPEGRDHGYAAGASFPLNGKFSEDVCFPIIDELGGKNVLDYEGMLDFQIKTDMKGLFTQYGEKMLLIIYLRDSETSEALANSIELLDW